MAQQQEADISDAKNEISDLGTESQDTKQELKLQNCAERGTAGLDVEKLYHHHHLYHQRLPTAATSATCVASLHYPLDSQKQDERAGRSKSQFFKGNSKRCTADRERIRTGERSHRQPPEIVWANQGDYLRQICKKL